MLQETADGQNNLFPGPEILGICRGQFSVPIVGYFVLLDYPRGAGHGDRLRSLCRCGALWSPSMLSTTTQSPAHGATKQTVNDRIGACVARTDARARYHSLSGRGGQRTDATERARKRLSTSQCIISHQGCHAALCFCDHCARAGNQTRPPRMRLSHTEISPEMWTARSNDGTVQGQGRPACRSSSRHQDDGDLWSSGLSC